MWCKVQNCTVQWQCLGFPPNPPALFPIFPLSGTSYCRCCTLKRFYKLLIQGRCQNDTTRSHSVWCTESFNMKLLRWNSYEFQLSVHIQNLCTTLRSHAIPRRGRSTPACLGPMQLARPAVAIIHIRNQALRPSTDNNIVVHTSIM